MGKLRLGWGTQAAGNRHKHYCPWTIMEAQITGSGPRSLGIQFSSPSNSSPDASASQERPWDVQAGNTRLGQNHPLCSRGAWPLRCSDPPGSSTPRGSTHPHCTLLTGVSMNVVPGSSLGKEPSRLILQCPVPPCLSPRWVTEPEAEGSMNDPLGPHPTPISQKGKLKPHSCDSLPPCGKLLLLLRVPRLF